MFTCNSVPIILMSSYLLYRYKFCQSQVGSSDCGVFSLFFATAIAQGDDPSQYTFDQQKMRSHPHHCLEQEIITQFPTRRIGRKINKISYEAIIRSYCKCRMPDLVGVKMIECSRCKEWYHVV